MQINFAGTALLVGYNFIGTTLRAFGDSRTTLYFVFLATMLTAGLAPLFMGILGMGVAGAALAWLLAQSTAFLASLVYLACKFRQHTFRLRRPRWEETEIILRQGIPSGLQMMVIYAGIIYNLAVMLAIATVLFMWAEPLVRLFIQDSGSVQFGTVYLKTIAFFYPFIGLNFILNGVVRGAGAMSQVLILNIISLWLLRVPLAYGATYMLGEPGVALGIGASFVLSFLFSGAYYRWGGWCKKRLFKTSSECARTSSRTTVTVSRKVSSQPE